MNVISTMKNVITIILILGCLSVAAHLEVSTAYGKRREHKFEWEEHISGTIVDVDPLINQNGKIGCAYYFDGKDFEWIWKDNNIDEKWPSIGDHGILYKADHDGDTYYKWKYTRKKAKAKVKARAKAKPKIVAPPKSILQWKMASIEKPPVDKTVLIRIPLGRFDSKLIITTGYVTEKEEWKLETDRTSPRGGRALKEVKEWCLIPE